MFIYIPYILRNNNKILFLWYRSLPRAYLPDLPMFLNLSGVHPLSDAHAPSALKLNESNKPHLGQALMALFIHMKDSKGHLMLMDIISLSCNSHLSFNEHMQVRLNHEQSLLSVLKGWTVHVLLPSTSVPSCLCLACLLKQSSCSTRATPISGSSSRMFWALTLWSLST